MCTSSVSNVIYHKFSHGAAFYTLNGKNVNVMLEYWLKMGSMGRNAGTIQPLELEIFLMLHFLNFLLSYVSIF